MPIGRHTQIGFTYIGVLILVAISGIALAGTGLIWRAEMQREKEKELLFVGDQYRRAIGLYYERSPGTKKFPNTLDDLLRDSRYPTTQRYLRKRFMDPITGSSEWGLIYAPTGGIAGIFSLSDQIPRKQSNFAEKYGLPESGASYASWRFEYRPIQSDPK